MLKKTEVKNSADIKVTFSVAGDNPNLPASVVGEFNQWDPTALPLKKRSNGAYTANVTLPAGQSYRFRYVSADGVWFNDEAADAYAVGSAGEEDCLVVL